MLFRTKRHDVSDDISFLKGSVGSIREELDEHMQSINGNTEEIDVQNHFICELDNRMTKIEERMDEVQFLLRQLVTKARLSVELTKDEQRVFLILYTHEKFMKAERVADKSYLSQQTVADCLTSMMDKGLPIEREVLEGEVYVRMNDDFKLRQAKEQIIRIDPDVTSQYQNTLLKQFFEH